MLLSLEYERLEFRTTLLPDGRDVGSVERFCNILVKKALEACKEFRNMSRDVHKRNFHACFSFVKARLEVDFI